MTAIHEMEYNPADYLDKNGNLCSYGDTVSWLGAKATFIGLYPPLCMLATENVVILCNENHIEKVVDEEVEE